MAHLFPGWPGPTMMGNRGLIAPVSLPAMPGIPGQPAGVVGRDWTGAQAGAEEEAQASAQPAPWAGSPVGAPAPTDSPLARLAAFGVPVTQLPNGRWVIGAGHAGAGTGPTMPPDIPGMPKMPAPPAHWAGGGGGDLMQPTAPVQPFNPGNLAQQQTFGNPAAAMERFGPVSLGSLLPLE